MYRNDPLSGGTLTPEEQQLILGGEAWYVPVLIDPS